MKIIKIKNFYLYIFQCWIILINIFYFKEEENFSLNKITGSKLRISKKDKQNIILTLEQKEALIGIMLGDGFIERRKPRWIARLCIEQAYPEKKDYMFSLFELYKPLITNEPKIITRKADKRTNKIYKSLAFKTISLNCLNEYHNLFYKNKIKLVPDNIHELLTARGLAYWIMDDGSKSSWNRTTLHIRAFSKEEVILLQNALKINFKLNSRIEEKTKNQWLIYIQVRQ